MSCPNVLAKRETKLLLTDRSRTCAIGSDLEIFRNRRQVYTEFTQTFNKNLQKEICETYS